MTTTSATLDALERPTYRRDGGVKWGRLCVAALFSIAVAIGMGLVLTWAFHSGWYFLIVVPVAAAIPVVAANYLVVKFSHCRNMGVAVLVGLFTGLVLYPGWFHVQLVSEAGMQVAHRVDLLPRFILFRLQNDAAGEFGKAANTPNVVMNSIFFGVELFLVLFMTTGVAAFRATRVYCRHCGEWGRMVIQSCPPGSASLIFQLLHEGRLAELTSLPKFAIRKVSPNVQEPSASITVEACRRAGNNNSCCAFLTLKENPGTKQRSASNQNLMIQTAITREELGYLTTHVEGLVALAPPGFVPEEAEIALEPVHEKTRSGLDQVGRAETVSDADADSIYSAGTTTILAAMSFIPVVAFILGCGLLFLAWKFWPSAPGGQQSPLISIVCFLSGMLGVVFGAVVCWIDVDYFNLRQKFKWTREIISLRRDPIVSPLDHRVDYVEVVPRKYWSNLVTNLPLDGGFAVVEESPPALLFEGLRQRYRIPGIAILGCETVNATPDGGRFMFYATVVQVRTASDPSATETTSGVWEIPFMVRSHHFAKTNSYTRKKACDRLTERILGIMGTS